MPVKLPLFAAAALLLAGAGCSSGAKGARLTCAPPECAADTTLSLVAEIVPPQGGPYVAQELTSIDIIAATDTFTLALDPVVTLTGTVSISGTLNGPTAATVVATRPSRISGRPDVVYTATVDPISGVYSLPVSRNLAGEQYVVSVAPADPTLVPPMQRTIAAVSDREVDFALPDPLTLPQLHGTIVDSLQDPIANVQLQATDPTSGQVLSTTVTSDSTGAFSLRLLASPPGTVQITAAPISTATTLPTLTQAVDTSKLSPTTNALTVNLA
ncbi:MAG TPA: carboxypeptidase-like regulatory domain-containing protein, partial [Polyangia bacterium]|nr:carboxypeptidase-like regulatory domain-containing protein [Polyangia bacterium]